MIRQFSLRTGWHVYPTVLMPDGTSRAVWPWWDGPDFQGFFTAGPGAPRRPTDRRDYLDYCRVAARRPAV